jgi:hypothetical protein
MGESLQQIFAEAKTGATGTVTIVTNQDDGSASYAVGKLVYHGGSVDFKTGFSPRSRLSTTGGEPLDWYFSDRKLNLDKPIPGMLGESRQPFSANALEKLGVSISDNPFGPFVMKLTFVTWGNGTSSIPMEPKGKLLVGVGPPLSNTDHAVYVVSFGAFVPPR